VKLGGKSAQIGHGRGGTGSDWLRQLLVQLEEGLQVRERREVKGTAVGEEWTAVESSVRRREAV
jgi:hypothetical protein